MPRRSDAAAATRLTGTQSIKRALTLLREIAAHNRSGSRLLDLAMRTGLQRPTVHRMLKCLAAENMVQQDGDNHRYFLGPMVFELGLTAAPRFNLREICHPSLSRIAEATGDTVFLTQRSGLDSVCLDRREGTFPIKTFTLEIGMRRPLGVGTGSLAILSALPEDAVEVHVLPNLGAVNVVIKGLLGDGVAASTRFDPQAKGLGEWMRARSVHVQEELL